MSASSSSENSCQGMCSTGSQNAQNQLQWGMKGWSHVPGYGPGFLDCWAVGPWVKNSKMITAPSSVFAFEPRGPFFNSQLGYSVCEN